MGATHRFVQGRYLVVEVVATLVEAAGVQAQRVLQKFGADGVSARRSGRGVGLLQQVQQPAGVAVGITDQGVDGGIVQLQMGQHPLVGALHQQPQLVVGQHLQHVHLGARQQGRVHLERRVFGGRTDKGDQPRLHKRQQAVLLAFVEAVNFVHKQDRFFAPRQVVFGLLHGGTDVLDARKHR